MALDPRVLRYFRPGITGFLVNNPVVTQEVVESFRASCHEVARELSRRVTEYRGVDVCKNYHEVCIAAHRRDPLRILLHGQLPWIGFSNHPSGTDRAQFPDIAELSTAFGAPLEVIPGELLRLPFKEHDWKDRALQNLGIDADIKEFKRWPPQTIGDAIFNHYD